MLSSTAWSANCLLFPSASACKGNSQDSCGKYSGQTEFLLCGNVQLPHHRHGKEEEGEIRDHIAEAMYGGYVRDLDLALGRRFQVDVDIPGCFDRVTGEEAE